MFEHILVPLDGSSLAECVLPHVVDGALNDGLTWSTVQLVPGQRPLAALASLVAPLLGVEDAAALAMMRAEPRELPRALRRAQGPRAGLAIFVDQIEELVTIAEPEEADRFAAVVAELASGTPGLRVLATVRSDC